MSLGTNIQFLRKRNNLTQEDLAETMEVSRQTVSKWESDAAFPETDKLIKLSELFGCTMDTLIKGDAPTESAEDTTGYDREMNSFTRSICAGVSIILAGVVVLLLLYAFSVSEIIAGAVFMLFVAISAAVFIVSGIRHGNFVKDNPQIKPFYSENEIKRFKSKFPVLIAAATVIVLAGVILLMICEAIPTPELFADRDRFYCIFTALLLVCVNVGACMFIYAGMQYAKYDIESYNKENNPDKSPREKLSSTICGVIMLTATIAYLLMGFLGELWSIGWVVFPVGGILCAIVSMIFGTKEK